MSPSQPLGKGAARRRSSIWASAVAVTAMALIGVVALSTRLHSKTALLSVSGMEKEAKLEHKLTESLAAKELAHFQRINSAAFPTTAEVDSHAAWQGRPAVAKMMQRARMQQARKDRALMDRALKQQAVRDTIQMKKMVNQEALKIEKSGLMQQAAKKADTDKADAKHPDVKQAGAEEAQNKKKALRPSRTIPVALAKERAVVEASRVEEEKRQNKIVGKTKTKLLQPQLAKASTHKKMLKPTEVPAEAQDKMPKKKLGDNVYEIYTGQHVTDDGDVHLSGHVLQQYMFKQKRRQQLYNNKKMAPVPKLAAAPTHKKLISESVPEGEEGEVVPSAAEEEGAEVKLGDDIFDVHSATPTDDGDVHAAGDDVEKYMFKQTKGQKLFLGEGPWAHVPVEHEMSGDGVGDNADGANGVIVNSDPMAPQTQMRVNPSTTPCLTNGDCEETPFMRDWDMNLEHPTVYPATFDAWTGNNHGLFKSKHVQQLAARRTLPPSRPQRQRLFLGEGPWATVPVEHEMSGRGVGDNIDGANGILVDSNPLQAALPLPSADEPTSYWGWTDPHKTNGLMSASMPMKSAATPPCRYRCLDNPSGWCEGHPGLTDGDCEEVIGFEHSVVHSPEYHAEYPATYGSGWNGDASVPQNGLFKAAGAMPSLRAMAAAQFRMQEAQDNEPAGLASLANPATPLLGARRAPGLGALAPTVQITRLVQQQQQQQQLQQQQQMLEGEEEEQEAAAEPPAHPWRASEYPQPFGHSEANGRAPHCVGGVGPCGDNYIDKSSDAPAFALNNERQSDVETDVSKIVPFMYKHNKGATQLRLPAQKKAALTMLAQVASQQSLEGQVIHTTSANRFVGGLGLEKSETAEKKGDAMQKGASKVPVASKALRSEAVPVLGAEELGGDDESVASKALSNGRGRWDQIVEADGSHKLSKLLATPTAAGVKSSHDKKRAALTNSHHLEESNLDGMSDQLVSVSNGQIDAAATPRWTKFYSAPEERGGAQTAAKDKRQVLEKVTGDETLDHDPPFDNVQQPAEEVGKGPHAGAGELQWDTFYLSPARTAPAGGKGKEDAAKKAVKEVKKEVTEKGAQTSSLHVAGRATSFLSAKAANQDIDNFFDSLDKDPVHGAPRV